MKSVVIIGLGLMGGSVAKALKNKNPNIFIEAFDHNESALDLALDVGIIDQKLVNLEQINNLDQNLIVAIITPDKDIVSNAENLNPAYLVFNNYEIILKWNRSLRFALAVCTLKDLFINEI